MRHYFFGAAASDWNGTKIWLTPLETRRALDSLEFAGVVEYLAGPAGALAAFFLAANAAVGAEATIKIASRRAPLRIVHIPRIVPPDPPVQGQLA